MGLHRTCNFNHFGGSGHSYRQPRYVRFLVEFLLEWSRGMRHVRASGRLYMLQCMACQGTLYAYTAVTLGLNRNTIIYTCSLSTGHT